MEIRRDSFCKAEESQPMGIPAGRNWQEAENPKLIAWWLKSRGPKLVESFFLGYMISRRDHSSLWSCSVDSCEPKFDHRMTLPRHEDKSQTEAELNQGGICHNSSLRRKNKKPTTTNSNNKNNQKKSNQTNIRPHKIKDRRNDNRGRYYGTKKTSKTQMKKGRACQKFFWETIRTKILWKHWK